MGVWFSGWDLIRRLVTRKDKAGRGITGETPMAKERRGGKKEER